MENGHTIPIDEERVFVKVADIYKDLGVEKPPIPVKMKPFEPAEYVINFKLVDPNKDNEPVTKFDEPIELWVQSTENAEKIAKERDEPQQLAYWNGDYWVRFKEDEHGFGFRTDDRGRKYGVALVSEWTDPPIAWGT